MGRKDTIAYRCVTQVRSSEQNGFQQALIHRSYRVNLFGFPNAPGLSQQNLGLLDQRAAYVWNDDSHVNTRLTRCS